MFLRLNQNAKFDQNFINRNLIDGIIEIPLGRDDIEVPDSLLEAVGDQVNEFAGIGNEGNSDRNQRLIEELDLWKDELHKFVESSVMVKVGVDRINQECQRARTMQVATKIDENEEEKKEPDEVDQQKKQVFKGGKLPTFLGIDVQCDNQFKHKLKSLFVNTFTQAGEEKEVIEEFKLMVQQD